MWFLSIQHLASQPLVCQWEAWWPRWIFFEPMENKSSHLPLLVSACLRSCWLCWLLRFANPPFPTNALCYGVSLFCILGNPYWQASEFFFSQPPSLRLSFTPDLLCALLKPRETCGSRGLVKTSRAAVTQPSLGFCSIFADFLNWKDHRNLPLTIQEEI